MSAQAMFGQEKPPQAEPAGPYILNLLWVTDNLERAEAFYHRLLGLESPEGDPRARLVWYAQVPFLDDMYGVKGNTRNFFLHVPVLDRRRRTDRGNCCLEQAAGTHISDPGAVQLIFTVSNIDRLATWLGRGSAKALQPRMATPSVTELEAARADHSVSGFQRLLRETRAAQSAPPNPLGPNGAPPSSFINGVSVGVTIDDTEKTARFYHDVLGVDVRTDASFAADAKQLDAFSLTDAQYHRVRCIPGRLRQLHFFRSGRRA